MLEVIVGVGDAGVGCEVDVADSAAAGIVAGVGVKLDAIAGEGKGMVGSEIRRGRRRGRLGEDGGAAEAGPETPEHRGVVPEERGDGADREVALAEGP